MTIILAIPQFLPGRGELWVAVQDAGLSKSMSTQPRYATTQSNPVDKGVDQIRLSSLIGRALAAGNVVKESGCLYISSVAADGNPISREQHREMGLPSADALKM